MYQKFGKRTFDLCLAITGLIFLSPLFILIPLLLIIIDRQRPFFLQNRPGLGNKIFMLVKFKTMYEKQGVQDDLFPEAKRVTPFGNFLRKTSLDELPQLWNVLIGNMSIIGPRPLLVEYLPLYNLNQQRRHEVRPGISGWAQIHGRNMLNWESKFALDIWYIDNISFLQDLKIIALTIKGLFSLKHISTRSAIGIDKFTGEKIL
jgi:undecaprenyl phosphate N,N'-diacetylbacillosamine 1-phosphate transferase